MLDLKGLVSAYKLVRLRRRAKVLPDQNWLVIRLFHPIDEATHAQSQDQDHHLSSYYAKFLIDKGV